MKNRFIRMGTMAAPTVNDCPLAVEEVALWRDAENDVLFLTPKIKNEYDADVTRIIVGYEAVDEGGKVIERESGYVVEDIIEENKRFGEDLPITLQQKYAVGGKFVLEEAVFADGYTWKSEKSTEEEADKEDITMVKTIGGFGPQGATFRKVPLSMIVAQRMTTQFVTTIIAVVICVWSLAGCISYVKQSDEKWNESLSELLLESEVNGIDTEEEAMRFIADNGLVPTMRYVYVVVSVLIGSSILFSLYLIYYLRETRKMLRTGNVTDSALAHIVKRLRVFSIIELVMCVVCNFNFFGMFAGISGLSVASLHRRIMKSKENKKASSV